MSERLIAARDSTSPLFLLPTSRTSDPNGGGNTVTEGSTSGLPPRLLPTPNASDATGGAQPVSKRRGHSRQLIDYALEFS